jgi:Tfp pilus assembly protein PilV
MPSRSKVKDEDGFTIIEVLVAAFILVLAALAVFMTLAAAVRNAQRGKETQVGISFAQREMEKVRALPYSQLAMKTAPGTSTEATNPNSRVSGTSFDLDRGGTTANATMAISTSGEITPFSENATVGGTKVNVYRYVVWRKDTAYCATGTNSEKESCKNSQNYKTVIIAVRPSQPGNVAYKRGYYELQSDFVDPSATP